MTINFTSLFYGYMHGGWDAKAGINFCYNTESTTSHILTLTAYQGRPGIRYREPHGARAECHNWRSCRGRRGPAPLRQAVRRLMRGKERWAGGTAPQPCPSTITAKAGKETKKIKEKHRLITSSNSSPQTQQHVVDSRRTCRHVPTTTRIVPPLQLTGSKGGLNPILYTTSK